MSMIGVGIRPLSKQSLAKLRKGMPVRINQGQQQLMVAPSRLSKIQKAFGKMKGTQLALSPEEIEMNGEGIFGKAFDKVLKKVGIKKAVYKAGDKIKPIVKQAVDKGASALSMYAPALRAGINPLADLTKDYLDRPTYYQKNKGRNALRALKNIGVKAGTQIAREQAMKYAMGEGLYAGNGLYAGGEGEGFIRGVASPHVRGYGHLGMKSPVNMGNQSLIPALQSQPYFENFMWGRTLPPEYARLHY